jgi:hypothetical protein
VHLGVETASPRSPTLRNPPLNGACPEWRGLKRFPASPWEVQGRLDPENTSPQVPPIPIGISAISRWSPLGAPPVNHTISFRIPEGCQPPGVRPKRSIPLAGATDIGRWTVLRNECRASRELLASLRDAMCLGDVTGGAPNGDHRLIAWTPTGVRTKSRTLTGTYGTGRPLVTARFP